MKHVLITGGSDGFGKATAQKLVLAGFKVTILSRDEAKTKAVADELGCGYVVADVADAKQVEAAIQQAVEQSGEIDILINNAGVWITGLLESNSLEDIEQAMKVNALGTIYCTYAVVPSMKRRKTGRIINVISVAGQRVKAERSVYTATKWAMTGFSGSMQAELRPSRIAVTNFYPMAMDTEFFKKVHDDSDRSGALDPAIAAGALLYICQQPDNVEIPDLGIGSLDY